MSKTSIVAIVFIVLFTIFYTLPKILFITKPVEIVSTEREVMPKVDGFEENKEIEALLERYNFSQKEISFYREYQNGITINRFDILAEGKKANIFDLLGKISQLENVTIKGISIQKTSDVYLLRIEVSFIGER